MPRIFARTLLSLLLAAGIALAFWHFEGERAAYVFFSVTIILLFVHHAWMMAKLGRWLQNPRREKMPAAAGAWHDLFDMLYDTTQRARDSQARLQEALIRFRQVGEALPDGIVTLDRFGHISWVNPAAQRHFQVTQQQVEGKSLSDLVNDSEISATITALQPGEPRRVVLPQHPPRILNLQRVGYGFGEALIFSEDVTRTEQVETMRRDFIANVSHELRTPLTVLKGFAETLHDDGMGSPEIAQKSLSRMLEQATRMQRLVEDLLLLSRLEDPAHQLAEGEVDLKRLVDSVAEDARSLSAERHTIDIGTVEPIRLRGNSDELRSAFANLATNAVRYTPSGGRVTLSLVRTADAIEYRVEDTGEGIAAEHLPRLTERFYRVDKGRSRQNLVAGGGTGLGLAIVKHVLGRHDGRLAIQSTVGKGSTFTCVLPLAREIKT